MSAVTDGKYYNYVIIMITFAYQTGTAIDSAVHLTGPKCKRGIQNDLPGQSLWYTLILADFDILKDVVFLSDLSM